MEMNHQKQIVNREYYLTLYLVTMGYLTFNSATTTLESGTIVKIYTKYRTKHRNKLKETIDLWY